MAGGISSVSRDHARYAPSNAFFFAALTRTNDTVAQLEQGRRLGSQHDYVHYDMLATAEIIPFAITDGVRQH